MGKLSRYTILSGTTLAAGAVLAAPAAAAGAHADAGEPAPAVFAQTNDPAGNSVAVYDRHADGTLTPAGTYPTGGRGGALNGAVVDRLASQGSLTFDGATNLLYAVNAGSNTLSVFRVDGDQLTRTQIVGTGGSFPVSVTSHGNVVYVLNARDGGSIQGFVLAGGSLIRIPSWHRGLGLDPAATPEFVQTPGQIAFTPDGTQLVVTTKAHNTIDTFAINGIGELASHAVVTPDAGAVPFAVQFDGGGHLVVAEAGTNAVATFGVNRDGTLDLINRTPTGQAATCWLLGVGSVFYTGNAGSGSISLLRDPGDATLTALGNTSTDAGTVDLAASSDRQFLYADTGAAGIVDEYRIDDGGTLTAIGSVTVPDAAGGEGIAAS